MVRMDQESSLVVSRKLCSLAGKSLGQHAKVYDIITNGKMI